MPSAYLGATHPALDTGRSVHTQHHHIAGFGNLPRGADLSRTARHRRVDLGSDGRVLRAEVQEGDFGHGAMDTGRQSPRAPNARAAKHQMTSRFRSQ